MLTFVRLTRLILRFVFFLFHFFLRFVFCHLMSKIVFNVMMVCFKRQHNKMMQSKQQQPTIYLPQYMTKQTLT